MEQLNLFTKDLPNYKINKPIRLIELFAGIGSQAKALQNIGVNFENWLVCEIDKNSINSYNAIHNTNFAPIDIKKLNGKDLKIIETDKYCYILTYSFPCVDLSICGKQAGMGKKDGTRSALLWEVERILTQCCELPQILLMENVAQVHSERNIKDFEKWITFLNNLGYYSYWQDLNAKDYGVPQSRNRCFMISILGNYNYTFPREIDLKTRLIDLMGENLNTAKTNREALKILEPVCLNSKGGRNGISGLQPSIQNRIYDSNYISTAVTTCFMPFFTYGNSYRKLLPIETWRLMGFSDEDFLKAEKVNSASTLMAQAGNSIVVNVLEEIFKQFF